MTSMLPLQRVIRGQAARTPMRLASSTRLAIVLLLAGAAMGTQGLAAQPVQGQASQEAPTPQAPAPVGFEVSAVSLVAGADAPLLTQVELDAIVVELVVDDQGFLRAVNESDEKSDRAVLERIRLGQLAAAPRRFDESGIAKISEAIVAACNYKGFFAVVAVPSAADFDDEGKDLRAGRSTLAMEVFGAKVRDVRVQRMTEVKDTKPLSLEWAERRLERLEARIRAASPAIAGDAVRREPLSDYIHRLNRRPDRRVDAAIASADFPVREIDGRKESVGPVNEVQLNYMFNQGKPWTIYAQMSNTGTPETNEWRERFGFVHNQLTGRDDTLQLDYITAGFDSSHSLLGSYDTALDDAGLWRAKVNAGWSTYDATQVAGNQDFTGEGLDLGAEISRNVAQWGPTFVDVFAGVRYSSQDVDNQTLEEEGRGKFVIPAVGAALSRATDRSSLDASVRLETNVYSDQAADDPAEADEIYDRLGRISSDRFWWAAKGNLDYSRFLDSASADAPARNAHQIAASGRFQYAFDDARLVPTEQAIMGGFMSVRGYDESIVAGDSSVSGSLEYRLHIPQLFGNGGRPAADGGVPRPDAPGRDSSFRWVPDDAGLADWNLLARVFLDGAYVASSDSFNAGTDSFEFDSSLLSTGVGLELSIKRNFSARVDWGVALTDVKGGGGNIADSGDNRFHFLFTLMY